ncbi:YqhR family membrane protein [Bacillus sp. Bva_UNVM-123]|uniref:YqhR family membrane protein n=1 Tax=Bacillus sp. Bva_UNVM-123 TaxID=2829798 RepID=UPI00391F0119
MNNENQLKREHTHKPMSFITLVIITGFIGGVFWSGLGYLASLINLTEIRPNVILEPWTIGDWKEGWLGTIFSIVLLGGISIIASLIYYLSLRKLSSPLVGMIYGVVLFLLIFLILHPIFPGISPHHELSRDTIITSICLYILYGLFVGFTISYEESERKYLIERDNDV